MTIKNGDLPAMAVSTSESICQMKSALKAEFAGLTKREYFASLAMQAIIACDYSEFSHIAARRAVDYANALLAELERTK